MHRDKTDSLSRPDWKMGPSLHRADIGVRPSDRPRLPEKRAPVHLRVVVVRVSGAERVGPLVLRGDDDGQTQENHSWDDEKKRPESQNLISRKPKVDQHQKAAEGENDHTEKNASWIQLPHRSALLPRV